MKSLTNTSGLVKTNSFNGYKFPMYYSFSIQEASTFIFPYASVFKQTEIEDKQTI